MKKIFLVVLLISITACKQDKKVATTDFEAMSWDEITQQAKEQSVTMMMWSGDPKINAYMQDYMVPKIKKEHNINLQIVSGQGAAVVQLLMTEKLANKSASDIDLVWINGETFYQIRQIDGLYGPWTDLIPNAKYINFSNPFIGIDFQQPTEGFELPWGNVQMTLIYDSQKVQNPPKTRAELSAFVKQHPETFTFDNHFTGLTFLKALLIDIAGGNDALSGEFDEEKYKQYSEELWQYISDLKPYLWNKGEVFPENVAQMHQLFAGGELWFTMKIGRAHV